MRHEIIKAALGEFGVKELPGAVNNSPRILEYFTEIGFAWVKEDETAWCSVYVNYIVAKRTYDERALEIIAVKQLNQRGLQQRIKSI